MNTITEYVCQESVWPFKSGQYYSARTEYNVTSGKIFYRVYFSENNFERFNAERFNYYFALSRI